MKIYHGSIIVIEKPIYGYGKKHNDYGLAFYCTESLDLAKEWAVSNELDGYANCYELDLSLILLSLMFPLQAPTLFKADGPIKRPICRAGRRARSGRRG